LFSCLPGKIKKNVSASLNADIYQEKY
jgi:hypothetical protein